MAHHAAAGALPTNLEYDVSHNVNTTIAIRWLGVDNCEEVFAFLGLEHSDDEADHSVIYLPTDGSEVKPGDWIVPDEDGDYRTFTDAEYRVRSGSAVDD